MCWKCASIAPLCRSVRKKEWFWDALCGTEDEHYDWRVCQGQGAGVHCLVCEALRHPSLDPDPTREGRAAGHRARRRKCRSSSTVGCCSSFFTRWYTRLAQITSWRSSCGALSGEPAAAACASAPTLLSHLPTSSHCCTTAVRARSAPVPLA